MPFCQVRRLMTRTAARRPARARRPSRAARLFAARFVSVFAVKVAASALSVAGFQIAGSMPLTIPAQAVLPSEDQPFEAHAELRPP